MKIKLVLILAISLINFYASADPQSISGSFWSAIGDQFNTEELIEPSETHELLLRLKDRLKDKFSGMSSYQVQRFLDANNVEAIKCNRDNFEDLDSLIATVHDYPENLEPYLRDCRERQYQLCRPLMEKSMKEDIKEFVEGEGKDAKKLIDAVFHGYNFSKEQLIDRQAIKELNLVDGVSEFLESKVGQRRMRYYLYSFDGYEKFKQLYKQLVVPECRKVIQIVDDYDRIYYLAGTHGDRELVMETIDDLTAKWIFYSSVCRDMVMYPAEVSWAAYRKLNPSAAQQRRMW